MVESSALRKGVSSDELVGAVSSFQEDLDPLEYAKSYSLSCYPEDSLYHDEQLILDFLVGKQGKADTRRDVLDIGAASIIPYAVALSRHARSVHMADINTMHLELVSDWVQRKPTARSWKTHTRYIIEAENRIFGDNQKTDDSAVEEREDRFRKALTSLVRGDLCEDRPLRAPKTYDAVMCLYAMEPAVAAWSNRIGGKRSRRSIQTLWSRAVKNLCSLVAPGGEIFLSVICQSDFYVIRDLQGRPQKIHIAHVDSRFLEETLKECGIQIEATKDFRPVGLEDEGMSDVSLIYGKRRR